MAIKGPLIAFFILTFFAIFGGDFLNFLGIGKSAFQIAGGMMLSFIAFEMVFERRNNRKSKTAENLMTATSPEDISVFPIAIPMLAGPGAITSIMLMMNDYPNDLISHVIIISALGVVLFICIVIFAVGSSINKLIGKTISAIMTRLLGIILSALSVQFITDGLLAIFSNQ